MGLFDFLKTSANRQEKKNPGKKPKKKTARKTQSKAQKMPKKKAKKKIKKKPQKRARKTLQKKKLSKYPKKSPKIPKEKKIGVITHYFNNISVGIIKVKTELKVGDKIHIKGAHDDFIQAVTSMQLNHKDISSARKGAEVGIKVNQRVHENDKVYRAASE